MVNNYPEYAAGVNYKKTDTDGNRHFYSAQVVADPANETVESKLIKDGVVIDEGGATVEALNVTENGTYSEEGKAYSPVVVNVAGGASDFSTATVTVINNTGRILSFKGAVALEEDEDYYSDSSVTVMSEEEIIVIMYKGVAYCGADGMYGDISTTGNVIDDDGLITITGDGTITFGAPK